MSQALIGKTYSGGTRQVTAGDPKPYAAATDDHNPVYTAAEAIAPPMFQVPAFTAFIFQLRRSRAAFPGLGLTWPSWKATPRCDAPSARSAEAGSVVVSGMAQLARA